MPAKNTGKRFPSNGPYAVTLQLNYRDTALWEAWARKEYPTLRAAQDALPGVRLEKCADDYRVLFGVRRVEIGRLAKAPASAPALPIPEPSYRTAARAALLTITGLLGWLFR